jgi:two-component system, sensor histidine kinase PdtaS
MSEISMTVDALRGRERLISCAESGNRETRSAASYERELKTRRDTENQLRHALAAEEAHVHEKDALIGQLEVLAKESDHRLLNGLQLVASIISMQGRASTNAEAAAQLAAAADRVAMIVRVHRRLHCLDGEQTAAFKEYLEDLCRDFSTMVYSNVYAEEHIKVESIDVRLPTAKAVPLGYIVNELITNAAKHGGGGIVVKLEAVADNRYALSVANNGPPLREGFDPAASKGLGMRIVRAFVAQLRGELRIDRGERNEGVRFTVLFS